MNHQLLSKEQISEEYGEYIYRKNPMLRNITDLMENPAFKEIYRMMKNPHERDTIFYFFWIYEEISKHLPNCSSFSKLAIMHRCISQSSINHELVQIFRQGNKTKKLEK